MPKKLFLFIFSLLLTVNFLLSTVKPAFAARGGAPNPQPCKNAVLDNEKLTDNYITDANGDPPIPRFTVTASGPAGTDIAINALIPSPANQTFTVDFSQLQAIFGAQNSNYLEGNYQSQTHQETNLSTAKPVDFNAYHGPGQKTAPIVLTDQLRVDYVKYIFKKPELPESANKYSDINGQNPKTVYEMVNTAGFTNPPVPPSLGGNKATWNTTWGMYWEKIPTAFSEFYLGKLEFRAIAGLDLINQVKTARDKNGNFSPICPKSIRTIEFVMPDFYRTTATSGELNQIIVPLNTQSPTSHNFFKLADGAKNFMAEIIQRCVYLATQNPISKKLHKIISELIKSADPVKTAYAQTPSCTLSTGVVNAGGTVTITSGNGLSGSIGMQGAFGSPIYSALGNLPANGQATITVPGIAPTGLYVVRVGGYGVTCKTAAGGDLQVNPAPQPAPTCVFSPTTIDAGQNLGIVTNNFNINPIPVNLVGTVYGNVIYAGTIPQAGGSVTIPAATTGVYEVRLGNSGSTTTCTGTLTVNAPANPPACSFDPATVPVGRSFTVISVNGLSGQINMQGAFGGPVIVLGTLAANLTTSVTIPTGTATGTYVVRVGGFGVTCKSYTNSDLSVIPDTTPGCTFDPAVITPGVQITVTSINGLSGEIRISGAFWDPAIQPSILLGNLPANGTATVTVNLPGGLYAIRVGGYGVLCTTVAGGGGLNIASCSFSPTVVQVGDKIRIQSANGITGKVYLVPAFKPTTSIDQGVSLPPNGFVDVAVNGINLSGIYTVRIGGFNIICKGTGNSDLLVQFPLAPGDLPFKPLSPDSCIKNPKTSKNSTAPYCALPLVKSDGKPNLTDAEAASCTNKNDTNKLDADNPRVVCKFTITWTNDHPVTIPTVAEGNGEWDSCNGGDAGRTCKMTIAVWPDFRIPLIAETWNNTLYSVDEPGVGSQNSQVTGRPGVYSYFTPKGAEQALTADPLQVILDNCVKSTDTTRPIPKGCEDLVNWATAPAQTSKYPGLSDCVMNNLFTGNLTPCFINVARSIITKTLPGNITSQTTSDVKQRFIGATDCFKNFVRDVALKPLELQKALKIEQGCKTSTNP